MKGHVMVKNIKFFHFLSTLINFHSQNLQFKTISHINKTHTHNKENGENRMREGAKVERQQLNSSEILNAK